MKPLYKVKVSFLFDLAQENVVQYDAPHAENNKGYENIIERCSE
jgi:hypothetical protein